MAVIMAMAGSAIGLGNIWRFPYMAGEYGGAAFIFIYILASIFLSLPIFLAESIIGRRSGANCRGAMRKLAPGSGWKWLGYLSILTPIGASFVKNDVQEVSNTFSNLISSTWSPIVCHLGFLLITVLIVAAGVKSGIEKFSKFCLPVLFVLIVAIMLFSITLPGAKDGINYLLKPDFSKITPKTFAYALGQSFYSLSLGMGIIITYSSYVSKRENLFVSAAGTAFFDLLFAILAGFAIMPAVFAAGIEPSSGAGLIFQTLPFVFNKMGATMPVITSIAAVLFFLTILFSALTSSVSLVEVGVAYLTEEKRMRRGWACFLIFIVTGVVGILASLSFGPLRGVHLFGKGFFDFLDTFSSNFLLTIGGFLCAVFVYESATIFCGVSESTVPMSLAVSMWVFPVPGPALTYTMRPSVRTASFCCGLSPSRCCMD